MGHGTAEEVGYQLLHLSLLKQGARLHSHLPCHSAAEALATVGKLLHHGTFIVCQHLVEQLLQLAVLDFGRCGRHDEGGLAEHANLKPLLLYVGNQFLKNICISGRKLAVDWEKQLLSGDVVFAAHKAVVDDALVGCLLVYHQQTRRH